MAKFLMIAGAGIVALGLQGLGAVGLPGPAIEPARPLVIEVNRAAKADRLPGADGYVKRVRTTVIRLAPTPMTLPDEIAYRPLAECESLVSPLADAAFARRARVCAT